MRRRVASPAKHPARIVSTEKNDTKIIGWGNKFVYFFLIVDANAFPIVQIPADLAIYNRHQMEWIQIVLEDLPENFTRNSNDRRTMMTTTGISQINWIQ